MTGTFRKVRNKIFALSMAGALGFGVSEVLAAPARQEALACSPGQCDRDCKRMFGEFASGFCELGACSCAR